MSDNFDIIRFSKFMNDLENDNVRSYKKKQVLEQNYQNYKEMLEESVADEVGNMVSNAMNSNTMKKLGYGLKGLTKAALDKFDDVVLNNSAERRRFKKATRELFQSYKEDLSGLIENYFYSFDIFETNFWNDTADLLQMSAEEKKSFLTRNKHLIAELKKESLEYKKAMRKNVKNAEPKLSIVEYFTKYRSSRDRTDEINNLLRAYTKWVKETTNKMYFPLIKDFSGYMILKYMSDTQKNESSRAAEIYTLIEEIEEDNDESNI